MPNQRKKKKYDAITIGSASQDVYVFSKKFRVVKDTRAITGEVETFAFGTKIELDDILFEIGGGATNAAYTLASQGLKTACLSRIGNDGSGQEVAKFFKRNKIADFLIVDTKQRTAHSVVFLSKDGERTILVYRGAAHHFKTSDVKVKRLASARWLYISSLAGNTALLKKIVDFAHQQGIRIMLNPGRLEIKKSTKKLKPIFKKVDILLLNREEAIMINQRAYDDDKGMLTDLRRLCPGIIIVTKGGAGSLLYSDTSMYRILVKRVKAIDTTGAGDAFGSGFLAGYIQSNGEVKKAIMMASANASSVIKKIGAKHGLLAKNQKIKPALRSITNIP